MEFNDLPFSTRSQLFWTINSLRSKHFLLTLCKAHFNANVLQL